MVVSGGRVRVIVAHAWGTASDGAAEASTMAAMRLEEMVHILGVGQRLGRWCNSLEVSL